jgi:hypothetical protein
MLFQVGTTPEGLTVWGGVYAFFETHGLPLGDLLFHLWARQGIPDWKQLVEDMAAAGRPFQRCVEAVRGAVGDACYPSQFRDAVMLRLQAMAE